MLIYLSGINTITSNGFCNYEFSAWKRHIILQSIKDPIKCVQRQKTLRMRNFCHCKCLICSKLKEMRRSEIKWKNQAFSFCEAQVFPPYRRVCYYPRKCQQRQMNWFTVDGNRNPNRQINTQMHRNYIFKWIDFEPRICSHNARKHTGTLAQLCERAKKRMIECIKCAEKL